MLKDGEVDGGVNINRSGGRLKYLKTRNSLRAVWNVGDVGHSIGIVDMRGMIEN